MRPARRPAEGPWDEFAWRTARAHLVRNETPKWLLRHVLARYVPRDLIERLKMGFAVPMHDWLRGLLQEWAEELMGERRLEQEGLFTVTPIRDQWEEHLSARGYGQYKL